MPDEPRDGYTLDVLACCERSTLSGTIVRGWLSALGDAADHLPSGRSGRSAYRVRPSDLEQLLARITVPSPLPRDAIRPKEAAEIFAGRSLSSCPRRDYARHIQAVDAEVERGRLTAYGIAGVTRYARLQVEEVAKLRDQEGYRFEASPRWRARKAERERAQRDGLLTAAEAAERCGVVVKTVMGWAREGRYGAVKRGGWWFLDGVQLPPARAKPMPPVTRACAVCGAKLKRSACKVRRAERSAESAGRDALFFCRTHLNTEQARALVDPSRRRRWKLSAETCARLWTPERRTRQAMIARQVSKRVKAGEQARRTVKMARTRFDSDLSEQVVLRGITTRRVRNAPRNRAAANRAQQAVELRKAGRTDEEICAELVIGDRQLRNYYREAGLPPRKRGRPKNRK